MYHQKECRIWCKTYKTSARIHTKRVQNRYKTSAMHASHRDIELQPLNRINKNRIKNNKQDPVLSMFINI